MAFSAKGRLLKTSLVSRPLVARAPARLRPSRARRVVIESSTRWSLEVDKAWCDMNQEKCDNLEASIDLSETISRKLGALVGETQDCDFAVTCNKTGVKILFESVGTANPLDSPAELYMTDVGGKTIVSVDGKPLTLKQKVRLNPGAKIGLGDFAMFQVYRNVNVHA